MESRLHPEVLAQQETGQRSSSLFAIPISGAITGSNRPAGTSSETPFYHLFISGL
jgi:hypothetical protein